MSYESEVLVVGAGPTGLVAAITLAQQGVNVIVVDAAISNNNGARAAVVHAHTLEILSSLGIADAVIERGIRCDKLRFSGDASRQLLEVDMSVLKKDTPYPFSVLISQAHVEEALQSVLESLKVEIHRGNGITGIKRLLDDKVEVMLSNNSTIATKYIIGADGAHSTIRHLVGIDFKDPETGLSYDDPNITNTFQIALADVYMAQVPSPIPLNEPTFQLDRNLMLIPLPSSEPNRLMWRVGLGSPPNADEIPHNPPIEYFQEEINKRNTFDMPFVISSILSSSRYRVRAALADTYNAKIGKTHVLLVGDAAHVHSPVGGQGMNMGICDAVSAARTIIHHMKSEDDADRDLVFQTYTKKTTRGRRTSSRNGDEHDQVVGFWRRRKLEEKFISIYECNSLEAPQHASVDILSRKVWKSVSGCMVE
ncbi:hypothetical protein Clacol_009996 [Clathrus columnatus]|uniref:FAD-binding domain-containing protein n=1 Tax=Clathrus columnatus TaxID=1419009 RepID=A0AAV5ASV6_9AGAM|nr:hypothetical protein Clacol_009996 [Clathrus columnatus]